MRHAEWYRFDAKPPRQRPWKIEDAKEQQRAEKDPYGDRRQGLVQDLSGISADRANAATRWSWWP
jgi:hypothetical protein